MGLLGGGDLQSVMAEWLYADALFLFTRDHAGRAVPNQLGRLGLPETAFDLHIAWDIGAAGVTRRLSEALGAACILQRYSRLVIDCNRDPFKPDAIPAVSDGVTIPANEGLDGGPPRADRGHRRPLPLRHLDRTRLAPGSGPANLLVFVHSFNFAWPACKGPGISGSSGSLQAASRGLC